MSNTRMKIKLFSLPLDLEKSQRADGGVSFRPEMASSCVDEGQRKIPVSIRK